MTVGFVNGVPQVNLTGVLTGNGAGSAVTASSLTQHGVVVAGASNVLSTVAPGANNNVLTSNGTDWTSAAPPGGNVPAFYAYLSAPVSNVTGDNTIYPVVWNATTLDSTSSMNTGTGVYTFPKTGNYIFVVNLYIDALAGQTSCVINLNINSVLYLVGAYNPTNMVGSLTVLLVSGMSGPIPCTSGQTVHVELTVGNTAKGVGLYGALGSSSFSGYLVS